MAHVHAAYAKLTKVETKIIPNLLSVRMTDMMTAYVALQPLYKAAGGVQVEVGQEDFITELKKIERWGAVRRISRTRKNYIKIDEDAKTVTFDDEGAGNWEVPVFFRAFAVDVML
jgi:hypothetical protein